MEVEARMTTNAVLHTSIISCIGRLNILNMHWKVWRKVRKLQGHAMSGDYVQVVLRFLAMLPSLFLVWTMLFCAFSILSW